MNSPVKENHYVILGNGPAGNSAADAFRENDINARITIISNESFSYYFRHRLTDFISGSIDTEGLVVRPFTNYKEKNIRLRLGQQVDKIDPAKKILYLRHMEKVNYTGLIIATGGRPRVIPSLKAFQEYLIPMYRYTDAAAVASDIENWESCTVIGSDITSLRFIEMLAEKQKSVHVILYPEAFWPFTLTDEIVEKLRERFTQLNIRVSVNDTVSSITAETGQYSIATESGFQETVDRAFVFPGLVPNIDFVPGSGIDSDIGILVNDHLQSNFPDIYACGDCAQIYHPSTKDYWVSIGWKNARIQGKTAAMNLLGSTDSITRPKPEKIIDIEGIKVRTSWWDPI